MDFTYISDEGEVWGNLTFLGVEAESLLTGSTWVPPQAQIEEPCRCLSVVEGLVNNPVVMEMMR